MKNTLHEKVLDNDGLTLNMKTIFSLLKKKQKQKKTLDNDGLWLNLKVILFLIEFYFKNHFKSHFQNEIYFFL